MKKSALFFFFLSCCLISMTFGCKDKKPEVIVLNEPESVDTVAPVDTLVIADTVPVDEMDSLISATPMPKAADELFDDFLFNFTANKKLQYERVKFPLKVVEGDQVSTIDRKEWQMEKFFMKQEFYTLIFDDESQLELPKQTNLDSVVVEKIFLAQQTVEQHVFNRENGQWMLTEIHRNTTSQNPNKSFLAFYEKFASDSLFQVESLDKTVETILPDPEDDFTMIEGEFHPDQWEEFRPPVLPHEFIYNIIYGQKYTHSKQKLFVVRGISNGLETEMTFRQIDGKWKLVKLVN